MHPEKLSRKKVQAQGPVVGDRDGGLSEAAGGDNVFGLAPPCIKTTPQSAQSSTAAALQGKGKTEHVMYGIKWFGIPFARRR